MIYPIVSTNNPIILSNPKIPRIHESSYTKFSSFQLRSISRSSSHHQNPSKNDIIIKPKTQVLNPVPVRKSQQNFHGMSSLCGLGYWVQGFRCFPWLALHFHMAHNLNLDPSTLQLVQSSANLPMVVKPLYGIVSDALYIEGPHRVLSWSQLALIPVEGQALTTLMACVLLSNLGASIEEVSKDALVIEYGQKHRIKGLQSYSYMALAAGGILGNFLGGYFLLKPQQPRTMFLIFSALLSLQLAISSSECINLFKTKIPTRQSVSVFSDSIRKQLSGPMIALDDDTIFRPLAWILTSIVMVPILSGSTFCYQTQCLNLDLSVIGMSKVIGQLMLLSLTVIYDNFWKQIPMRKLIGCIQFSYAVSLLFDLILVRQINVGIRIPNEVFALCFCGLAETIAQFKILPFTVLSATLCPKGCEGSFTSFLASTVCLSSIISGFLGVGLSGLLGIKSGDYSSLSVGLLIQFFAALLPLGWIHQLPMSHPVEKCIEESEGFEELLLVQ